MLFSVFSALFLARKLTSVAIGSPITNCPGTLELISGICKSTCKAGSFSTGERSCRLSSNGFYVPYDFAIEEIPCPAGTYSEEMGAISCERCKPAMFSKKGASYCHYCGTGSSTLDHITCRICPSGTYSSFGDPCQYSAAGTFVNDVINGQGASGYTECLPGSDSKRGAVGNQMTACTSCPFDTFGVGGVPCEACPEDETSEEGSVSADDCTSYLVYTNLYIIYDYTPGSRATNDFTYTTGFIFQVSDTIAEFVDRLPYKNHLSLIDIAYYDKQGGTEIPITIKTNSLGLVMGRNANTRLKDLLPVSEVFLMYVYTTDSK